MPKRALFFKRRSRFQQAKSLIAAAVLACGALLFFFLQKREPASSSASAGPAGAERGLASFSALDKESHLLSNEEEPDPEGEIAAAYRDTLSVPQYDYTNQAEAFLENQKIEDRRRALTDHIAEEEAEKAKEELAQRIIERNRKKGFEIVLDEDFNVISAKAIKKKKPVSAGKTAPEAEAAGGKAASAPRPPATEKADRQAVEGQAHASAAENTEPADENAPPGDPAE